ncbi:large ribosomal subunit protein mL62-like [Ptychodera flava]|uniref:large ribosomal subunit protein mL62-like n=1 Tax=Ptychodera flava TaxID=63121 RepID=UPI00396A9ED3
MLRSACIRQLRAMGLICRSHSLQFSPRTISTNDFKSVYSLDKLYPNSNPEFGVPYSPHSTQEDSDKFTGHIPIDQLTIKYSRSSGPGGQNVNKVNSKVDLRFHVPSAEWIPEDIRNKMMEKFKTKINARGELIVTSDRTRMQIKNLADCLQKVREMVEEASQKPKELSDKDKTIRRLRTERAHRERLRQKKLHSTKKQDRNVYVD